MAGKMKVAESSGADVVTASVQVLANSGAFAPDHGFMRRIAWVESKDGTDANTYRAGYHGGIWQVDEIGFKDTRDIGRHAGLRRKLEAVKRTIGIDWETVSWEDLRKPLYSALAARLFLANVPSAIPSSLEAQARYWKTHYNTEAGSGTAQKFIDDVRAL